MTRPYILIIALAGALMLAAGIALGIADDTAPLCAFKQCDGTVEVRHCDGDTLERKRKKNAVCGDHNGDGCVTATDSLIVLRASVGLCEAPCD